MNNLHTEQYNGYTINIVYNDFIVQYNYDDLINGHNGIIGLYGNNDYQSNTTLLDQAIQTKLDTIKPLTLWCKLTPKQKQECKESNLWCSIATIEQNINSWTVSDWLSIFDVESYDSEELKAYSTLCKLLNLEHTLFTAKGHSQGEWQYCLTIADSDGYQVNKEYVEACLYGGFYNAEVLSPEGESIECYADGYEYPYTMCIDEAKNYIDADIEEKRSKHEQRTKIMIKNRVPLLAR